MLRLISCRVVCVSHSGQSGAGMSASIRPRLPEPVNTSALGFILFA